MEISDPCYKCLDRHISCHADCEKYIKWSRKLEERRQKIIEVRNAESLVTAHVINSINKNKRHRHE